MRNHRTLNNYKCTLGHKESFSEFHTAKIVWTILSALKLDGGRGYIKRVSPVSLKKKSPGKNIVRASIADYWGKPIKMRALQIKTCGVWPKLYSEAGASQDHPERMKTS